MVNVILTACLVALIVVGLTDYIKDFIPETVNPIVKVVIAIVLTIGVGIVASILSGFNVLQTIAVIAFALAIAKVAYAYFLKFLKAAITYFKDKIKLNS